jgi:hypothetical protein
MAGLAIALAGGGAKGDFEVGALHYVYRHKGVPQGLCTTSVGSVNGLKLAEGETGADRGLAGLTSTWLSLTSYADFFAPADWLHGDERAMQWLRQVLLDMAAPNPPDVERRLALATAAEPMRTEIPGMLERLRRTEATAIVERRQALSGELEALANIESWQVGAAAVNPAYGLSFGLSLGESLAYLMPLVDAAKGALTARSVFTLGPLWDRTRTTLDLGRVAAWADAGGRLRMTVVSLHSGLLRYVTERGAVLERDGRSTMSRVSTTSACDAEESAVGEAEDRVDEARDMVLRRVPGAGERLERAQADLLVARAALTQCLVKHPPAEQPLFVDPVSGMIASATMPTYFPAIGLHDVEEYVDGGVRMVLPIEPAISPAVGVDASEVVAIAASKLAPDWATVPHFLLLDAAMRSVADLAINEIAARDASTTRAGGPPVTLIAPEVDIHTAFTIYPAFVRNRMAYGWMCAADALHPPAGEPAVARARQIAEALSVLRYGAARLECWLAGQPVPPTMVRLPRLEGADRDSVGGVIPAIRQRIAELVDERRALGARLPDGTADWDDPVRWVTGPEVHAWAAEGVDDAGFVRQDVPPSIPQGGQAPVSITMRNAGRTTWQAADGHGLASVSTDWGVGRLAVPRTVHVGEEVTFQFSITSPPAAGNHDFQWQMHRHGVWFGDATDPVAVAVAASGEPRECDEIRRDITTIDARIAELENQLIGDPKADGPKLNEIQRLRVRRNELVTKATTLGCAM